MISLIAPYCAVADTPIERVYSRPPAKIRAEISRLRFMVQVYQKVMLRTSDFRLAETIRQAIKVCQYDIHELLGCEAPMPQFAVTTSSKP